MERSRIGLCLFLLSLHPVVANQDPVTAGRPDIDNQSEHRRDNWTQTFFEPDNPTNATGASCLIDGQTGLIAVASAGGLILCLLASTVVLACQVCHLQRRVRPPRPARGNVDLVSGTGYWGTDQPAAGGLVGPCDASVMLEEVRADRDMEKKIKEDEEEKEAAGGALSMEFDREETPAEMASSTSRDSCLGHLRDLEETPLVV